MYDNIYDVRKRSDILQKNVQNSAPTSKDTLQNYKQEVKKEALNRLRHTTKYVIFQNSFMRVGKYLFVAVAFLPYLALFAVPKWLVVAGFPFVFNLIKSLGAETGSLIKKPITVIKQFMIQVFNKIQRQTLRMIRPIMKLARDIGAMIKSYQEVIKKYLRLSLATMKKKLTFPRTRKLQQALKHKFFEVLKSTKQIVSISYPHVTTRLKQILKGAQKLNPLKLFSQPEGKPTLINALIQPFQRLSQTWKTQYALSKTSSQHVVQWAHGLAKRGMHGLKQGLHPFRRQWVQNILPTIKKIAQSVSARSHQMMKFLKDRKHRALNYLQKKQAALKKKSVHHLLERLLSPLTYTWMPAFLGKWLIKLISIQTVQTSIKAFFHTWSFFIGMTLNISEKFILLTSTCLRHTKKSVLKIYSILQEGVMNITPYLKIAPKLLWTGVSKGCFGVLVALTMTFMILQRLLSQVGKLLESSRQSIMNTRYVFRPKV